MNRAAILAAFAAAAAMGSRGARAADLETLHIASALQDDIAPLLYGTATGIFTRLGLDIKLQPANSGAAAAAAVLGGSLQLAKGGTMAVVSAHARGVPLTAIWPAAISTVETPICGLVARKNSGITTGKDCNGKIFVGASLQDLNQLGAMAWVDATGGDSKTLRFVEVPSSATLTAVENSRVDVATMLNPTLQIAMRSPTLRVLVNPFDLIAKRFASSTWFTTTDYVAKNTDVVRRFVAGLLEAGRYETAHPTQMGAYLAPYLNMDEAALAKFPRTPIGLALDPADYQPVIDVAVKYGVIPKRFPATEMISAVR